MIKNRKRLIGLIVALLMICMVIPIDALKVHAGGPLEPVSNIGVSIQIPYAGKSGAGEGEAAPALLEVTSGEGFYITDAYWYNEGGISEPTFTAGHNYFAEFTVNAEPGYTLSDFDPKNVTLSEGLEVKGIIDKHGGSQISIYTDNILIKEADTTDITINVVWDDRDNKYNSRPDSLDVVLHNYTNEIEEELYTVKASDGWKLTIEDLPLADGNFLCDYTAYAKSVYSGAVPGYTFLDASPENDYTLACIYDEEYEFWVSGVQVNSENKNDVLGDGTVKFDPDTYTLTLNDANIPAGDHSSGATILSYGMDLTVEGSGVVNGLDYGFLVYHKGDHPASLTFKDADVTVTGDVSAIVSYGDVTVSGGSLTAEGPETAISSTRGFINDNAEVSASSDKVAIDAYTANFLEGEGVTYLTAKESVVRTEGGIKIGKTHNILSEPYGALVIKEEILKHDCSGPATDVVIAPFEKTTNVYKNVVKDVWYRTENGIVECRFTGIVKEGDKWIFVRDGEPSPSFEGIAQAANGTWLGNWYYCKNGEIDKSFSGIAQATNGIWYYCKKGKIDRTFTDKIAPCTNGNKYYVKNGKPTKNFDQKIAYCPADKTWYYCTQGRVNLKFSGKIAYCTNGDWYYITKGLIDRNFTGIAEATNGKLYYVKKGKLDKTFSGTVKYNGKTYTIKNGAVKKVQ